MMIASSGCFVAAHYLLLTCFLGAQFLICINALCVDSDWKALVRFKKGLVDPENRLSSWQGHECCRWSGVSCDNQTGFVTSLDLHNPYPNGLGSSSTNKNGSWDLSGRIDPSLLQLKSLTNLDLSGNAFEAAPIPEFIGNLSRLRYLNLSNAGFAGAIPARLGNLSMLQYLDLSWSSPPLKAGDFQWVSGLSSLIHLTMDGVDLSTIGSNWIHTLNRLSSLRELHLTACGISGMSQSLPWVNLTSLTVMDLAFNSFNSTIPEWFLNLSSLVHVDLTSAGFHGLIPVELSDLPNLRYLDIELNDNLRTNCSVLLGGRWRRIESLRLGSNRMYGFLPASIGNITSLVELDLFFNEVEGGIPSSIGKLCNLKTLNLASNNLSLGLPESLEKANGCMSEGSLPSLAYLSLANNQLAGTLPHWLGELRNLLVLDLGFNSIRGPIPPSLQSLSHLTDLSLEGNELNGTLPPAIGGLTELVIFDVSSNQLTGTVTESHLSKLRNLKILSMSSNSLIINITSGWIPPFRVRNLGMGSCQLGPQFPFWLEGQRELKYLDFSNASISAEVPTWFWDLSSNLSLLNISFNQIEGQLPNPLKVAAFADIDMRWNLFSGPIPILANGVELLDLSDNQFTGLIPPNIGELQPDLIFLSLSDNNITGTIPASIGTMQGLQVLDLSRNNLMGVIPPSLQNCSYLKALGLDHNNLSGAIPSLGGLEQLQTLHLSDNMLSGAITPTLQNCSSLETLDLGTNNLDGGIPSWIGGSFPVLRILRLRSNRFSGQIPPQLSNLSSLQVLDLAENELVGAIPRRLGDLKAMYNARRVNHYLQYGFYRGNYYEERLSMDVSNRQLVYTKTLSLVTSIDLSGNKLTGEIPESLAGLFGLLVLDLSDNRLTGGIPDNISDISEMLSLDLSNNLFSGGIPPSMSSMTFLSHLNLSNNNFSGRIPIFGQFSTFEASAYYGNPYLCGTLLAVQCEETKADINDNGEDDDASEDEWYYLSVGLGFAVGLLGVYVVISIRKPWRAAYFSFVDGIFDKILEVKNGLLGATDRQTRPRRMWHNRR